MTDLTLSFSLSTDWSHMSHDEQQRALFNKQKDLLRQFDATTTDKEYDGRKSFMDRVKELFQ